jgi:hypothetical protein
MKVPRRPRQPTNSRVAVKLILRDTSVSNPIDDGLAMQDFPDAAE